MKRTPTPLGAGLLAVTLLAASPSAQCERARVLPEGAAPNLGLGAAVALSGDRLALATEDRSEVHVLRLVERHAYLEQRLAAPAGALGFGTALDLEGNVLVVGTPFEGPGAVYVYEDLGAGFQRVDRLVAAPTTTGGQFGTSVALSGTTLAVGEPYSRTGARLRGAVTLFDRVGGRWTRTQRVQAEAVREDDEFGRTLALAGSRLAVGAPFPLRNANRYRPGAVFLFERTAGRWNPAERLVPTDAQTGDMVGSALALRGEALVVGAERANNGRGSLTLYRRVGGAWTEAATLVSDGGTLEGFGTSVAISEDAFVIAAGQRGESGDEGRVRIFENQDGSWLQTSVIQAPDAAPDARFGAALDLGSGTLLVGAPAANGTQLDAGVAYVYDLRRGPCGSLSAGPATISLSAGGQQTLLLSAGARHAGATYVLAGSSTGHSPGNLLLGHRVPLNPDAYHALSMDPARTWLTGQTGTLDGNGQAAAILNVPAGASLALPGQVLHHAFVLRDAGGAYYASNAVRVELRP